MGSSVLTIAVLIIAIALGVGITWFAVPLIGGIDEQTEIIMAIVLSLFAFSALYFMTKSRGN
ncbi:MAG: hypothetical protein U0R44_06070 [Candidatus Micrarchaeia archaeon]